MTSIKYRAIFISFLSREVHVTFKKISLPESSSSMSPDMYSALDSYTQLWCSSLKHQSTGRHMVQPHILILNQPFLTRTL